jgi:hypothetical protein
VKGFNLKVDADFILSKKTNLKNYYVNNSLGKSFNMMIVGGFLKGISGNRSWPRAAFVNKGRASCLKLKIRIIRDSLNI